MIPRKIHQVWIGPMPAPTVWMDSWSAINPDWEYILWDNTKVYDTTKQWRNQRLIDHYTHLAKNTAVFTSALGHEYTGDKAQYFAWHIIADILRYEILFEHGGYMPDADTLALLPLTEHAPWLDYDLYTLNTGHLYQNRIKTLDPKDPYYYIKCKRFSPDNASPILAASRQNRFLDQVLDELTRKSPGTEAVDTTGNVFMGEMLRKYPPDNALILPYIKRANRVNPYSIHFAGTMRARYSEGIAPSLISTSKNPIGLIEKTT